MLLCPSLDPSCPCSNIQSWKSPLRNLEELTVLDATFIQGHILKQGMKWNRINSVNNLHNFIPLIFGKGFLSVTVPFQALEAANSSTPFQVLKYALPISNLTRGQPVQCNRTN